MIMIQKEELMFLVMEGQTEPIVRNRSPLKHRHDGNVAQFPFI